MSLNLDPLEFLLETSYLNLDPNKQNFKPCDLCSHGPLLVNLKTDEILDVSFALMTQVKVRLLGGGFFGSNNEEMCDGVIFGKSSV